MSFRLHAAFAALAIAAVLTGCGGGGGNSSDSAAGTASVPGGAAAGDVEVINGWAEALQDGDIQKAAGFWKVPSIASNGTPGLTLKTEAQVEAFNEALPCGAELVKATSKEGMTTATFELTDRPGGGCGPGAGGEASTIFKIEDGKIAEWRRAPDPGGPTAPPAPSRVS